MSWKFNPPPGWPEQPEGWVPPPGWTPDPNWPPPPAGWQFWVPATPAPAPASPAPPPQSAPPPAAPPPTATPPLTMVPPPLAVQGGSAPPYSGGPGAPFSSAPPGPSGHYMPGGAPPPYGVATRPRRPWFGQWWGILGLIALLLLGAAIGYGATRVALDSSEEDSALGPAVTSYDPSHTIDDGYRGAPQ